jgi:hypothetical protein
VPVAVPCDDDPHAANTTALHAVTAKIRPARPRNVFIIAIFPL